MVGSVFSSADEGEGGYDVRGKKNYLPPAMLVLGYGVLWTTEDEETMERHARPLLETTAQPEVLPYDERVEEHIEGCNEDGAIVAMMSKSAGCKTNTISINTAWPPKTEEEEINQEIDSCTPTSTKRHLSAKQRRDLKKGKPVQDDSEESDVDEVSSSMSDE